MVRKYLHVTVYKRGGLTFTNPLKLSEAHLISKLAQEHVEVVVRLEIADEFEYKVIFG